MSAQYVCGNNTKVFVCNDQVSVCLSETEIALSEAEKARCVTIGRKQLIRIQIYLMASF